MHRSLVLLPLAAAALALPATATADDDGVYAAYVSKNSDLHEALDR
jgi:hypothetical protein